MRRTARGLLAVGVAIVTATSLTGFRAPGPAPAQAAGGRHHARHHRPRRHRRRRDATSGAYAFILPRSLERPGRWRVLLRSRHHDYPAIDIPVPTGTPYFSITGGTVVYTQPGNPCGRGLALFGRDGVLYVYCHGSRRLVRDGARVHAGEKIGLTGATGDATGPHLHFQLTYDGTLRCPQPLLWSLYSRRRPAADAHLVRTLPRKGCFEP